MSGNSFQDYYSQLDFIEGWVQPTTAIMSYALLRHQVASGIAGNVCEIGVHHGKYFIGLCTALLSDERGIAVDLFEAQQENVDNSGNGNRQAFDQNVAKLLNSHRIVAIQGNSTRMSADDIAKHGPVRFFSVDGGHTEAITENDLRIAERAIGPGGIVAVDDIISYYWTGVVGGVARYKANQGTLIGFAMVPGKLLMCAPEYASQYRSFLRSAFIGGLARADGEFLGDQVDIYLAMPSEQLEGWAKPAPVATAALDENAALKAQLDRLLASRRYRLGSKIADVYNRFLGRA